MLDRAKVDDAATCMRRFKECTRATVRVSAGAAAGAATVRADFGMIGAA
jgi:hypothetical protein